MTTAEREQQILPPKLTVEEADMARAAQRCIMAALDHSKAATITLESDDGSQPVIQLPPQALRFIAQLLGALSERKPVVLMPTKQELSTVEAANYLNVSRPFVIKEIESKRLACRMVGSHRRIAFDDLQAYASKMRADQRGALQRMADNAREIGLDYFVPGLDAARQEQFYRAQLQLARRFDLPEKCFSAPPDAGESKSIELGTAVGTTKCTKEHESLGMLTEAAASPHHWVTIPTNQPVSVPPFRVVRVFRGYSTPVLAFLAFSCGQRVSFPWLVSSLAPPETNSKGKTLLFVLFELFGGKNSRRSAGG